MYLSRLTGVRGPRGRRLHPIAPPPAERGLPTGAPEVSFTIVHSMPGRMRLRVGDDLADRGEALAERLRRNRQVAEVRWNAGARSLTIFYRQGDGADTPEVRRPAGRARARHPSATLLVPAGLSLLASCLGMGPFGQIALELMAVPLLRGMSRGSRV